MDQVPIQVETLDGEVKRTGRWNTNQPCLKIGRSPGCHIVLDDPDLQPIHCRVKTTGNDFFTITLLGGPKSRAAGGADRKTVQFGETVRIGSHLLRFGDASGSTARNPQSSGIFHDVLHRYGKGTTLFVISLLLHLLLLNIVLWRKKPQKETSIETVLSTPKTTLETRQSKEQSGEKSSSGMNQKEQSGPDQQERQNENKPADARDGNDQPTPEKTQENKKRSEESIGLKQSGGSETQDSGKGRAGTGNGGRSGSGSGSTFFGATSAGIRAKQVVFVIDTSGSMDGQMSFRNRLSDIDLPAQTTRLNVVKAALKNVVTNLEKDQNFNLIFFSHRIRTWRDGGLVRATRENRQSAKQFIDRQSPGGKTYIYRALKKAFNRIKRENAKKNNGRSVIYFLSDGEPTKEHPQEIKKIITRKASNHRIKINAIGINQQVRMFMKQMAEKTGGYHINYGCSSDYMEKQRGLTRFRVKIRSGELTFQQAMNILDRVESKPNSTPRQLANWLKRHLFNTLDEPPKDPRSRFYLKLLTTRYPDQIDQTELKKTYMLKRIGKFVQTRTPELDRLDHLLKELITDPETYKEIGREMIEWTEYLASRENTKKTRKELLKLTYKHFSGTATEERARMELARLRNDPAQGKLNMAINYRKNGLPGKAKELLRDIVKNSESQILKKKAKKQLKSIRKSSSQ